MAGLTFAFARRLMLSRWQDFGIHPPEVRVQHALLVRLWDAPPQQATRLLAPPADGIGHDLTGAAALGQPDPALVLAPRNERPEFIKFQHVVRLRGSQRRFQRRQRRGFF